MIVVALTTVMFVAGLFMPKSTAVPGVKPVPVIVTNVLPPSGPADGLIADTVGAYVKTSYGDVADVPPAAITVDVYRARARRSHAAMDVPLATLKVVAGLSAPKSTAETSLKPVPVIVTQMSPAAGPLDGLM